MSEQYLIVAEQEQVSPYDLQAIAEGPHLVERARSSLFPPAQVVATPTSVPAGKTLYIYRGHTDSVSAVAWSPDGKYIASGSFDFTVKVWNAFNDKQWVDYQEHVKTTGLGTNNVRSVAWSPNDRLIASASQDTTVQVWNASTGKLSNTYRDAMAAEWCVAWFPNGQQVVSAPLSKVYI